MAESDNIALVQGLYTAFGRGDIPSILGRLADDISWEFESPDSIEYAGVGRGGSVAARFFQGIAESESDQVIEMGDFVASGNKVASFGRYSATVRRTGRRYSTPVGHLFEIRDGKVTRFVNIVNSAVMVEARGGAASA